MLKILRGQPTSNAVQPANCLLCAALAWKYGFPLDGTEFMGGTITGPILKMSNIGILIFLVAMPLAFLSLRRISGLVTLVASFLCLPLYLYFTLPGPFRWVFRGQYKIPLQANVVGDTWAIVGILAIMIASGFGLRDLLGPKREMPKRKAIY
jgi:hypothetical protein